LMNAGLCSLLVLACGSLAARVCRQPVRRARIVVLTLLCGLLVPVLLILPIAPPWSAGLPRNPAGKLVGMAQSQFLESEARLAAWEPRHIGRDRRASAAAVEPGSQRSSRTGAGPWHTGMRAASWFARVPWNTLLPGLYFALSGWLAAWWLLGQFLLWRIT